MNLIKKYYPTKLDNFILDDNLKNLLKIHNEIDDLNILLIGEHGSGKTNLIKILVNTYYNFLPDREINKNITHINSLCDLGINSFRQNIKLFCQTCCSIKDKKKFVIIDELDNLNQQNQQILRNSIDKYSHRVNFICSCVNIQKILDNIQSRLTIIKLSCLSIDNINSYFNSIFKNEHIEISKYDFNYIVKISNFNLNVIFNNIQKLILIDREITREMISNNCTNINFSHFEDYIKYIHNNDIVNSSNILNKFFDNGFSVNDILENLFDFVKYTNKITDNIKYELFKTIGEYITYFYTIHEEKIELFLFTNKVLNIFKNYKNNILLYRE